MARSEQGVTLPELLVVLLVLGFVLAIGVASSLPWLGREEARSAAGELQSRMQLARVHAIARNRSCMFVLDAASRRMQVVDLNDPSDSTDDILLADSALSSRVTFNRPDSGPAITLDLLSTNIYGATFTSDGSISSGAGDIFLLGGDRYARVYLLSAGGVRVEHWNGSGWVTGS